MKTIHLVTMVLLGSSCIQSQKNSKGLHGNSTSNEVESSISALTVDCSALKIKMGTSWFQDDLANKKTYALADQKSYEDYCQSNASAQTELSSAECESLKVKVSATWFQNDLKSGAQYAISDNDKYQKYCLNESQTTGSLSNEECASLKIKMATDWFQTDLLAGRQYAVNEQSKYNNNCLNATDSNQSSSAECLQMQEKYEKDWFQDALLAGEKYALAYEKDFFEKCPNGDQSNAGEASSGGNTTSTTVKAKFNPGHYILAGRGTDLTTYNTRYEGYTIDKSGVERHTNEGYTDLINEIKTLPYVKGVVLKLYWADIESASGGDYSIGIKNIKKYADLLRPYNKKLQVSIQERLFNKSASDMKFLLPKYLYSSSTYSSSKTGIFGLGAIYISNEERTALIQKALGKSGGDVSHLVASWEPKITERLLKMHKALAEAFDNDEVVDSIGMGEELALGQNILNNYPHNYGYSNDKYHTEMIKLMSNVRLYWKKTNVKAYVNWYGPGPEKVQELVQVAALKGIAWSQPDILPNRALNMKAKKIPSGFSFGDVAMLGLTCEIGTLDVCRETLAGQCYNSNYGDCFKTIGKYTRKYTNYKGVLLSASENQTPIYSGKDDKFYIPKEIFAYTQFALGSQQIIWPKGAKAFDSQAIKKIYPEYDPKTMDVATYEKKLFDSRGRTDMSYNQYKNLTSWQGIKAFLQANDIISENKKCPTSLRCN